MKPYYEDSQVTLYHGSCETYEGPRPDVLLTDPPYGISYKPNRAIHDTIAGDDDMAAYTFCGRWLGNHASLVFMRWDKLAEALAHIKDGSNGDMFGEGPRSMVVWDKGVHGQGDAERTFAPVHEFIAFYPGHSFAWPNGRPLDIQRYQRVGGGQEHPTQKPIALINALLKAVGGGDVFDPYAGSGTTLVSAKLAGRKAVGYEVNEEYCALAARRLAQGVLY